MTETLKDVVRFRGDRLFNGAVNMDWFETDPNRRDLASSSFVFHGPAYHGISQKDIGISHGHNLIDTANFTRSIIRQCHGLDDQSFTLAIAGYGTGKSHLGLTLATLLSKPDTETATQILESIESVDREIGLETRNLITANTKPCLVVALNGMQNFDLTAEITRQILTQIKARNLDIRPIDELRPRFAQAINLIKMATANQDLMTELINSCNLDSIDDVLTQLGDQDDGVYKNVHKVLADKNIQITALGGESIRDVLDVTTREYCGDDKPFQSLLVLFDEFGRYTEFATIRSHIAGSGVLQDLFEGIQNNSNTASFVGFIQFELNAYVQRVNPEYRNEILRYVTRYQSANRKYLSINLETLIASLFEKKNPVLLDQWFENDESKQVSADIAGNISHWFPQSHNHRLWSDENQFHTVIRKGCWPLSAYSTWFLYHLAAAGKHLQERSALALLNDAYTRSQGMELTENLKWSMAPVDLWSESLHQELLTSEEGGQQGAIAHAYTSVIARHGVQFESNQLRLLQAIVLASIMGLKASDKNDAIDALSNVSGVDLSLATDITRILQDEFNVIEWDESFKEFDILGDAVPRTQFLAFLRQEVANKYDETAKAALFASKATKWCTLLGDVDCDYADENKITTKEWRFQAVTSNLDVLPMVVKLQSDRWSNAISVDEPRGTIIYCYIEPDRDLNIIKQDVIKLLRAAASQCGLRALPILVVLLQDEEGRLGQYLAELSVLDESISNEKKAIYGNLIPAHSEKTRTVINELVGNLIKARHYITAFEKPIEANRLSRVGTEIFKRIYSTPILFPFDGFSTARGNAATTCQELTSDLLSGKLDWDAVLGKPVQVKNRAVTVLNKAWGIFDKETGKIRNRPTNPILRTISEDWDKTLSSGSKKITLAKVFRDLCAPPIGANLASAGLFLGVYISPRLDRLSIIRNGQSYAISQWMKDGIFRGKYIDITGLHEIDLVLTGEEASQWESLMSEWAQADTHSSIVSYLDQAILLKSRIPIPPGLEYRVSHLKSRSEQSSDAMGKMILRKRSALSKIDGGIRKENVGSLAKGAASLSKLIEKLEDEVPLWDTHEIMELQPEYEEARQYIIQFFPEWIEKQYPQSESPDKVGDFKHHMLHGVCTWLEELELDELSKEVQLHTKRVIGKVEIVAQANQLIHEIQAWFTSHGDATEFVRIAEIRSLSHVGKEFLVKVADLSKRVKMGTLIEVRSQLLKRIDDFKKVEMKLMDRAGKLWETSLDSGEALEPLLAEVEALMGAFENCTIDLEDLHLMRQMLRLYGHEYQILSDDRLDWHEYEKSAIDAIAESEKTIGEDEVPWSPADVIGKFQESISKQRIEKSKQWLDEILRESTKVKSMAAIDANQLHLRTESPPAVLTDDDSKRLLTVVSQIESRLDELKLDWLVEKYRELPKPIQKEFLEIIKG
jgi:hypothetical protein